MSIFATQKETITIEGVNFVIKKLSLEKQLTISSLYTANKQDEAMLALIESSVETWDAKDDLNNPVLLENKSIRNLAVDVANKLSEKIMAFNNLNKEQVKN